ncbi:hypothetical protein M3P36_11280 [Altererythrobacter sp. KTW20L]|uniref:hypothetical protein n=1 Tax=Altererythrobacter sp. KTW20L TaxID=2942210 RepID=UPI0020BFF17A|nr:hypothetical protein [Altererythrobacter sp. KTW20L]MCL6251616.1 hypothetical protein [Altererythrobacter sp. KTW20L]
MRAAANTMMHRLIVGRAALPSSDMIAGGGEEFALLFESLELGGVWRTDVEGRFVAVSESIW